MCCWINPCGYYGNSKIITHSLGHIIQALSYLIILMNKMKILKCCFCLCFCFYHYFFCYHKDRQGKTILNNCIAYLIYTVTHIAFSKKENSTPDLFIALFFIICACVLIFSLCLILFMFN